VPKTAPDQTNEERTFYKEMLIDAIVGAGFPSVEFAELATKRELAHFSGNQWNADWEWSRKALSDICSVELLALYTTIKEIRAAKCL